MFRRLGVFAGGWTLEAAETIAGTGGELDVFGGLAALIDKSLVRQRGDVNGEPRFGLLETIGEFGLEQLIAAGEADEVRGRHASFSWP